MGLFMGSWEMGVDEKGRVFFPKRLITLLHARYGERPDLILARRPDQPCLVLQSTQQWEEQRKDLARLHPLSREYATFMRYAALTQSVSWDQQNRVLLEQPMRDLSGIQPGSTVLMLGCGEYVELWELNLGKKVLAGLVQEGPAFLDQMMSRLAPAPTLTTAEGASELGNPK